MNETTSENLNLDSQKSDKAAYVLIVKQHYRSVFALCLGILGNTHDAEDLAQEAILKGLRNIKRLNKNEQLEAWIMRIAKNLCIDFLRRKKRTKAIVAARAIDTQDPASENHDLHKAIKQLPYEYRLPLTMYYFEQKNAKIIASKLNISHSGACQRIREARKMLHEFLTERHEQ